MFKNLILFCLIAVTGLSSCAQLPVDRAIHQRQKEVKACYKKIQVPLKNQSGKVVIHFKVTGGGAAGDAEVSSTTLKQTIVEQCLLEIVKSTSFPAPKEDEAFYEVSYPFRINP